MNQQFVFLQHTAAIMPCEYANTCKVLPVHISSLYSHLSMNFIIFTLLDKIKLSEILLLISMDVNRIIRIMNVCHQG